MFHIEPYSLKYETAWERLVLEESVNGTFLQTRNFLNYHPSSRFKDCSLFVVDSGAVFAAIPACETIEDSKKCFISHKGSTFGGIIIGNPFYNTTFLNDLLPALNKYWQENNYDRVVLKLSSNLFCQESTDLLEYMLQLHNFSSYTEISSYIDLHNYKKPIISNLNTSKRQIIRKINPEYEFRQILSYDDCKAFYDLLCLNYKKFNAIPVHTFEEVLDFKNERLKDYIKIFGVFLHDKLLAGSMLFDFYNIKTGHTQYLASDPEDKSSNAMPFLYYSLIKYYKESGYRYLSWGISTQDHGRKLNFSLIRNKESYGSKYSLNRTFFKEY